MAASGLERRPCPKALYVVADLTGLKVPFLQSEAPLSEGARQNLPIIRKG